MLVLTRKAGQKIVIGGNIVVTVISQQGDRVKLGFEAPEQVAIHRQEVFERVQGEEKEFVASHSSKTMVAAPPLAEPLAGFQGLSFVI